jgi:hypothetical protein
MGVYSTKIFAPAKTEPLRRNVLIFLLCLAISASANFPLLGPYHFYADDYPLFEKSISEWFGTWGLWRIVGMKTLGWAVATHTFGPIVILLHATVGFLSYLILATVFPSIEYSLFFAILIAAFPWGYQALVWAASGAFLISSAAVLGTLYVLLAINPKGNRAYIWSVLIIALSMIALLANEAVFFSVIVAGIAIFLRAQTLWLRPREWILAASPLMAAITWGLSYEITKPIKPFKEVTTINMRSIFSGVYYQFTNIEVFDVWLIHDLRQFTVGVVNPVYAIAAISLLLLVVVLIILVTDPGRFGGQQNLAKHSISPLQFLFFSIVLLFAATGIYALAGGYSADSRKRYFIVLFLIFSLGGILWPLVRRCPWHPNRWLRQSGLVATAIIGCCTSFLVVTLWTHELARLDGLIDLLVTNKVEGDVSIEWTPYLHDLWPNAQRSWGDQLDAQWVMNEALKSRGGPVVRLVPDSASRISWDHNRNAWMMK